MIVRSFSSAQIKWTTFERESFGLSKGLQRLEPNFKGFTVIVWNDHKNNTCVNVLKRSKRVNKKITILFLEIHDIPHIRIWRAGSEMILGDVPSRWASHQARVRDLLKDLPLPVASTREIINQLFVEPDSFQAACRVKAIAHSQSTASGLIGPSKQGRFLELTGKDSAISAILKLNGCAVLDPCADAKFLELSLPSSQLELLQRVETTPVTLQLWRFPRKRFFR